MSAEHIITTNNKATKEFVDVLGNGEVPVAKLRRKLGKYKVRQAIDDLDGLAKDISAAVKQRFDSALGEVGEALNSIDKDLRDTIDSAIEEINLIEVSRKRHEGKIVDHVRLKKGVEVVSGAKATTFKVRK